MSLLFNVKNFFSFLKISCYAKFGGDLFTELGSKYIYMEENIYNIYILIWECYDEYRSNEGENDCS